MKHEQIERAMQNNKSIAEIIRFTGEFVHELEEDKGIRFVKLVPDHKTGTFIATFSAAGYDDNITVRYEPATKFKTLTELNVDHDKIVRVYALEED